MQRKITINNEDKHTLAQAKGLALEAPHSFTKDKSTFFGSQTARKLSSIEEATKEQKKFNGGLVILSNRNIIKKGRQ